MLNILCVSSLRQAAEVQLPQSAKGSVLSAFYWGYALTQVGWC